MLDPSAGPSLGAWEPPPASATVYQRSVLVNATIEAEVGQLRNGQGRTHRSAARPHNR